MRAFFAVIALTLSLALPPAPAQAQGWADQPFDPATMSREDVATLQAALAFSADYYGFLDGIWNADAQAALEAYVKREFGESRPLFRHIERPILALEDERVKNGWQLFYSETSNTSYLHPFELLKEVDNPDAVEFLSPDEQFSMIVRFDAFPQMKEVHDWFMGKSVAGSDPFQYNDSTLWITSTTIENDYIAYARSDFTNNTWATLSIVLDPMYFNHLNLLASSVTVGGSPATLIWTDGGVIDQLINGDTGASLPPSNAGLPSDPKDQVRRPLPPGVAEAPPAAAPPPAAPPVAPPASAPGTVDVAEVTPGPAPGDAPAGGVGTPPAGATPPPALGTPEPAPAGSDEAVADGGLGSPPAPVKSPGSGNAESEPSDPPAVAEAPAPRPKVTGSIIGSGTAFYIGPTTLVTAAHVIEGCSAVAMIDGTPLDIVAADTSMDLAVLTGAADVGAWLKLSALEVPKLGETVTALGYPYYTSLDQGLTVTSGNVSALRGADGSSNRVMITAPVQPGNSGGPLLNKKGAVIGVVVSRIDDLAVLEETGSLPQNMNFAVPSGPLLTFLAQNRVARPQGAGTGGEMGGEVPPGVAAAVIPLHCYQ